MTMKITYSKKNMLLLLTSQMTSSSKDEMQLESTLLLPDSISSSSGRWKPEYILKEPLNEKVHIRVMNRRSKSIAKNHMPTKNIYN